MRGAASFRIELLVTLDVHGRGTSKIRIFVAASPDALPLGGEQWPTLRIGSPARIIAIDHDKFVIKLLKGPEFGSPITARQERYHLREVFRREVYMIATTDGLAARFLGNIKEIRLTVDPSSRREISRT